MIRARLLLALVFLFVAFHAVGAEERRIHGTIRNETTKNPVPGAKVVSSQAKAPAFTDSDGIFVLEIAPFAVGPISVRILEDRYKTLDATIEFPQTTPFNRNLTPKIPPHSSLGPKLTSPPTPTFLAKALQSPDPEKRLAAVRNLGLIGRRAVSVLPDIAGALEDSVPAVALVAAETLEKLGPHAASVFDALLQAARASDPDVQCAAAKALRAVAPKDAATIAALNDIANDANEDDAVRLCTVSVLTTLSSKRSPAMLAAVKQALHRRNGEAARLLVRWPDQIAEYAADLGVAMAGKDEATTLAVLEAVAKAPAAAQKAFSEAFGSEAAYADVANLAWWRTRTPPAVVPTIDAVLRRTMERVAPQCLAPNTIQLVEYLRAERVIDDTLAARALLRFHENICSVTNTAAAAELFRVIESFGEVALEPLREALVAPSKFDKNRIAASLYVLSRGRDRAAAAHLIPAIWSDARFDPVPIFVSVPEIVDDDVIRHLAHLAVFRGPFATDRDRTAAAALLRANASEATRLEVAPKLLRGGYEAAILSGLRFAETVPPNAAVIEGLLHASAALPGIQERARAIVGRSPSVSVPIMIARFRIPDLEPAHAQFLVETLGAMKAEAAIDPLIEIVRTKGPKRALAIQALGAIGPAAAKAIPVLERLRRDRDVAVRNAAVQALAMIRAPTSHSTAGSSPNAE